MSGSTQTIQSIAIIGAGIVGLSCAVELADRGLRVAVFDKTWPPRGASWAAAGMLAPAFEAASTPGTHPKLFELCDRSAQLWPIWSAALEDRTGLSAGYQAGPSLAVAIDSAQARNLAEIERAMRGHRHAPERCAVDVSSIDPAISDMVRTALLLPSDGQVDNRRTLTALVACIEAHPNIVIHPSEAPLQTRGRQIDHAGCDATLVCAGWRTAKVRAAENDLSLTLAALDPVFDTIRSYGGQMLSVAPIEGAPRLTIRCGDLYIVPKQDRIVIGATTEPERVLQTAEADVIAELKARAAEICPVLAEAETLESWAGVRPGTKDHAPILGETGVANLYVASGHYRNGILLAPITAQIMADLIIDDATTDLAHAFSPQARLDAQV